MKFDASILDLPVLLVRLFRHVNRHRRYQYMALLCLTLVSSVAEVVSLGSVVPFIGIITQPDKVFNYPMVGEVVHALGITSIGEMALPFTILFAVAALIAGGLRLLLLWISTRLAYSTGADFSIDIYRRTLYQPYQIHIERSSNEIISGITQKVTTVTWALVSMVTLVTSSVVFLFILATLIVIDPSVAVSALLAFGSGYVFIAWRTRRRLLRNAQLLAHEQTQVIKVLREGLGAIRDVLLDGTQEVYCNVYHNAIHRLRRANSENSYMHQAPRYIMEVLGMVLIAVFALYLSNQQGGVGVALPVLAALAFSAQRLLPLMQQIYTGWSYVTGNKVALNDVLDLLAQPLAEKVPEKDSLLFQKSIRFDNVGFRYRKDSPMVLDGVHLDIPKGARIGFMGATGGGKSTALDLLMSLLEPTQGKILVDGNPIGVEHRSAWQSMIAHVPQNIFLADVTIAENIAFGVPQEEIDFDRVQQAADQAQIAEFIRGLPMGYDAAVGERGIRLSGGQRQRIGIARALYKQASVLVLDEATSALDNKTEHAVINAIGELNRSLTVLVIAHRITTLRHCDAIFRIENGRLLSESSCEHFFNDDFVVG